MIEEPPRQKFLQGRIDLVKDLIANNPLVSYADVVLIITAVLSTCASQRWPGDKIDKARFVELLVKHSPPDFRTSWVSVPALMNDGLIDEDKIPYGNLGNFTRIYCDYEIDLCIEEAEKRYPEIWARKLREHCYASLIYKWLRCGYSHEYCSHENVTHVPASRRRARLSYIGRSTNRGTKRMVSFHLDYLFSLAEYHISILPDKPNPKPSSWWIDKG